MKQHKQEIIIFEEPQPIDLASTMQCEKLGREKITDFSNTHEKTSSLNYADLKKAHTWNSILSQASLPKKPEVCKISNHNDLLLLM